MILTGRERDVVDLFVEVDLGTMAHHRLRGKLWRYVRYAEAETWRRRHPGCPPLVVLTTSEARADPFLRAVRAIKAKEPPSYAIRPREELLVAACGLVEEPARAVREPVWRTAPDATPVALAHLLGSAVRQHRQRRAWEAEQAALAAKQAPSYAVNSLAAARDRLAAAMANESAAEGFRVLVDRGDRGARSEQERSAWIERHAALLLALKDWWYAARWNMESRLDPPAAEVRAALRHLAAEEWERQARRLLATQEARRVHDPRLVPLALELATGRLIDDHALQRLERSPRDGTRAAVVGISDEYRARRAAAVAAKKAVMRRRERRRVSDEMLEAAYDADHLRACGRCGVLHANGWDRCGVCSGVLVPYRDRPVLPSIEQAPRAVAARLDGYDTSQATAAREGEG